MTVSELRELPMLRSAEISPCGQFRWWLKREWDADKPSVCFVMLNPSTADADKDDPTIRRCIGFAQAWGFGSLYVRNLYPYRATKPADLKRAMKWMDVTGGERGREEWIEAVASSDLLIAAWGVNANAATIQRFLDAVGSEPVYCIRKTAKGIPEHPLYLPSDLEPAPYAGCEGLDWRTCFERTVTP